MRKLLAVSPTSFVGGAETALLGLLDAARAAGWSVAVALPKGPFEDRLVAAGIPVAPIPDLKLPPGPRIISSLVGVARSVRAARAIRRAARSADLVLANGTRVLPAIRIARLRCPVVHLVRDVITRRSWRALLRAFGGTATLAIAPSEAGARPLRALGLAVRVVHHGVRWPVEPAHPERHAAPIVGIAANLTPLKGQHVALEAVARLGHRDVILELAGSAFQRDEDYEAQLRERAAKADLAGRVRFLGFSDDVLGVMRRWRIALLPSIYPDTSPLAMLEAMSLGVPMVATNHGGPTELLGDAGLLVPPEDVDGLAEAVSRLLDDAALYERCSRAGPRAVHDHLNVEREHRELLAVLNEVAVAPARATL